MKGDLSRIGLRDTSFELLTVGDLVTQGVLETPLDGNHGELHPKGDDFVSQGIPFIMASDIVDGQVDYTTCKFISARQARTLRKGFARPRDVLLTHKATIGRTALVDNSKYPFLMLTPQVTYYRVKDRHRLDFRYLRYYFEGEYFHKTFQLWADAGSTRAYLGITAQLALPVILPPIEKQSKIAAVLFAYDELIENNKRRIALLEKLAEEIYREWFVRLRFPGYENLGVRKGVPAGWSVRPLGSIAVEAKNRVKKKDLADDVKYLGLEHIPRRSIAIKEWATAASVESDKLWFGQGDILLGKIRPYLHKVALAHFSGACSSDTIVIRPKEAIYEGYVLFTVFSDVFIDLATVASKGTKMPRADWDFLKELALRVPDEGLVASYQAQFEPIFSQIVSLLHQDELLRTSRDAFLPRLLSGKLSVEDLDIQFPPGMAEEMEAERAGKGGGFTGSADGAIASA